MAFGYPLYVNGRELQQPFVLVHAMPGTYQAVPQPGIDGLGKIRFKIKLKGKGKGKGGLLKKVAGAVLTGGASLVPKKSRGKAAAAVLTGGASLLATKKVRSTIKKKPGKAVMAVLTGGASLATPKKPGKAAAALLTGGTSLLVPKKLSAKISATFKGKAKAGGTSKTTSAQTPSVSTATAAWMSAIKSTGKTKGLTDAQRAAALTTIKSTGKTKAVVAPVVDEAIVEEAAVLPEEPVVGFGTKLGIGLLGLLLVGGGAYLLLRKKSPSPSALGARSSSSPSRSVRSTASARRPRSTRGTLRTNRRRR